MVDVENGQSGFTLQARMSKAIVNSTEEAPKATVFSAFAVKETGRALVEIYMNVTSKTTTIVTLIIFKSSFGLVNT